MATEILSGASNPSYTNNTGQNVRIIINFMQSAPSGAVLPDTRRQHNINISWAGITVSGGGLVPREGFAIGKNVAYIALERTQFAGIFQSVYGTSQNAGISGPSTTATSSIASPFSIGLALPTELMLAPNQRFTATCGAYNIVVIPENG